MIVTRFAPSPNGPLHWGHAYSAIVAHDLAHAAGGAFLLRIEDIDGPRSRPELADEFRRDLEWLGLEWREVPAQGTRLASYEAALARLETLGVLYPCTCTRAEIAQAASETGPEGPVYPGTCKGRAVPEGAPAALRLDLEKALAITGPLVWDDGTDTAADGRASPLVGLEAPSDGTGLGTAPTPASAGDAVLGWGGGVRPPVMVCEVSCHGHRTRCLWT